MARKQFEQHLTSLQEKLLTMGLKVEDAVFRATQSLQEKNEVIANAVVNEDTGINQLEVDIDRDCFQLIALQQPVGQDLRKIATTLKVSNDLERMADHAASIAKIALRLKSKPYREHTLELQIMAEKVKAMVHQAIHAYIHQDEEQAIAIAKKDSEVDAFHSRIFEEMVALMKEQPVLIDQATNLLLVSQHLERISDYTTNICEWIVYLQSGSLIDLNR